MSLTVQRRVAALLLLGGLLASLLVARSSWPFEREIVFRFRGDRSIVRKAEITFVSTSGEAAAGVSWAFPNGPPPAVTARPSLVRGAWTASAKLETSDKTITVPVHIQVGDGPLNAEIPLD